MDEPVMVGAGSLDVVTESHPYISNADTIEINDLFRGSRSKLTDL